MPNLLLFQAYTSQQVAGCRYFLLKYLAIYNLKPPAQTTVVIYTNEPEAFEGFTNFFPHFQMPELLWDTSVQALTKTRLLQQTFLQTGGNVLYCDAATYPLQPLESVFADIEKGAVYLHAPQRHNESELQSALGKNAALRDKTATAVAAPQSRITVWDTAVVGINKHHNQQLQTLLQKEEAAPNKLATDYAYTTVLSETGKLKSAAKFIFDYSAFKEFNQLLETFFIKTEEESIPNQVKAVHHLDAAAIQQQKEVFQQQPLFKKWLQIISGKRWNIQQYAAKL